VEVTLPAIFTHIEDIVHPIIICTSNFGISWTLCSAGEAAFKIRSVHSGNMLMQLSGAGKGQKTLTTGVIHE
jgi:hypothetical protein